MVHTCVCGKNAECELKSVFQSEDKYMITKIHGVVSEIKGFENAYTHVFFKIIKLSASH